MLKMLIDYLKIQYLHFLIQKIKYGIGKIHLPETIKIKLVK